MSKTNGPGPACGATVGWRPGMTAKPPSESVSVLSRWMGIGDANNAGNVHGGVILHMCDEVAGIAAVRHSGCRCVTAGMDRMTFRHPVYVGL